jgi:hypothetical protein
MPDMRPSVESERQHEALKDQGGTTAQNMNSSTGPHDCQPPTPSGTTLPPPWRCPDCQTLWIPQEPVTTAEDDREVAEQVIWTWRRFEELTPD